MGAMHVSRLWYLFVAFAAGVTFAVAQDERAGPRSDDPDNPDNWLGLEYVHDRILAQLDRQEARWKEADDRLRFLLGSSESWWQPGSALCAPDHQPRSGPRHHLTRGPVRFRRWLEHQ